ncbi:MAG: hypothetical protein WB689_32940, partial [Xanthobacteraceae bacterium]
IAQGLFLGSFGRLIDDQPLPTGAMKEEHRDWARMANLTQPIAAYDGFDKKEGRVQIPWPASLVARYQTEFFPDQDLVLNRRQYSNDARELRDKITFLWEHVQP